MAKNTVNADSVSVDPKHYTVEAEDDRVRVLRVRYGTGEKSNMHSHPAVVAIFLTDGHIRFTFPDGKSEEAQVTAGQTMLMPATTHLPENIGPAAVEAILVEQKP